MSGEKRCETKHNMARRRSGWDYREPGRYMITLTLAERGRPLLARLDEAAVLHPTPLGRIVKDKWLEIAANWPGVEVEDYVIMPDHIHGILRLTKRQNHPLGHIIGSFKARTTSAARRPPDLGPSEAAGGGIVPPGLPGGSLWAPGYTDSILYDSRRYARAVAYIADNPRRLAEKRANPELFTVKRDLTIPLETGGGKIAAHFAALGNHNLLAAVEFHQVQCSRRWFAYAKDRYGKPLKDAPPAIETAEFERLWVEAAMKAAGGAVIVNPCISQGEREIARRLMARARPVPRSGGKPPGAMGAGQAGGGMIVLKNKGFSPLDKPEGALFDLCAAGRLLVLAPVAWPYTPGKKAMTRIDACVLNRIAQAIAGDGAAKIDYKGVKPLDIDRAVAAAVART